MAEKKNEAPTTVTEQVGRDFDPKNASGLYNKSKPLGPSAAGVTFGMIPYKTATGTREIPGVSFPALPKKQGDLEPAAVAPTPMSTFTPEEQAKADATYQKAFPVVSAADKGIAAADVEARVAAEKAGTPMPKTPSVFEPQSKTAMPAGISPAVEGTIPTAGKYTQMGEQNFAKYDTPTEFGIIQNAGPNEKALTPDAKGNFDWKKIRGMDNVTLTASAMNLTPEKQAEVDRKRLMSEYEGLTKKYGVGVPTLRAYEKRLGIGEDGMTAAQKASLDQSERHWQDTLKKEGRKDEAAEEQRSYTELTKQYGKKDLITGEETLDWVSLADTYPNLNNIKSKTVRDYVTKRVASEVEPFYKVALQKNAEAIKRKQVSPEKVKLDVWNEYKKRKAAAEAKITG